MWVLLMEPDTVAAEHPATENLLLPAAAFHNESVLYRTCAVLRPSCRPNLQPVEYRV